MKAIDRPVSLKEARAMVREEARKAQCWKYLDEQLAESSDLEAAINARRTELAGLNGDVSKAQQAVALATNDAETILANARAYAEETINGSQSTARDAERAQAEAVAALAAAGIEARRQIDEGKRLAAVAAEDATGTLGKLRKEIADAKAERAILVTDCEAIKARRDTFAADIEGLKRKLA